MSLKGLNVSAVATVKTVEIEPEITVDFNSAICHSLC